MSEDQRTITDSSEKASEEEIEFVEECERIKSWKAEALKIVKQRKAAEDVRKRREAERNVAEEEDNAKRANHNQKL